MLTWALEAFADDANAWTGRLCGRMLVMGLVVGASTSCSSGPPSADEQLCAEVERVVAELVDQDQPIERAQDVRILASQLVVAATNAPEGTPSPELAEVVRAAGLQGASAAAPELLGGLTSSYEACEDAGVAMDRSRLETLAER